MAPYQVFLKVINSRMNGCLKAAVNTEIPLVIIVLDTKSQNIPEVVVVRGGAGGVLGS